MKLKTVPLPRPGELERYAGIIANKDIPVLVSAIKGRADFLVTGDKHHFKKTMVTPGSPLKILTPGEFLKLIAPEILERIGEVGKKDSKGPQ
jgi:hypothetical protein